jgi:hypothetical protein
MRFFSRCQSVGKGPAAELRTVRRLFPGLSEAREITFIPQSVQIIQNFLIAKGMCVV